MIENSFIEKNEGKGNIKWNNDKNNPKVALKKVKVSKAAGL